MIGRTFFSQEQFGGGFCGTAQKPGDPGRLRTLGTIERSVLPKPKLSARKLTIESAVFYS